MPKERTLRFGHENEDRRFELSLRALTLRRRRADHSPLFLARRPHAPHRITAQYREDSPLKNLQKTCFFSVFLLTADLCLCSVTSVAECLLKGSESWIRRKVVTVRSQSAQLFGG